MSCMLLQFKDPLVSEALHLEMLELEDAFEMLLLHLFGVQMTEVTQEAKNRDGTKGSCDSQALCLSAQLPGLRTQLRGLRALTRICQAGAGAALGLSLGPASQAQS